MENNTHLSTYQKQLLEEISNQSSFFTQDLNYEYIHFNLLSLLEVSQKLLYEQEEGLDKETKIHIYNLLDMGKSLVNKDEYEFLNRLKNLAKLYYTKKKNEIH